MSDVDTVLSVILPTILTQAQLIKLVIDTMEIEIRAMS